MILSIGPREREGRQKLRKPHLRKSFFEVIPPYKDTRQAVYANHQHDRNDRMAAEGGGKRSMRTLILLVAATVIPPT